MTQADTTSVLKNRSFLLLWLAQATSQVAQNGVHFALMVLVESISRSSMAIGLLVLSFTLPAVLFGAPAGVMIDRWDKRLVLLVTNLLRAGVVLAYLLVNDDMGLAVVLLSVYAITFGISIVGQFFLPAEAATIPLLVRRDQLMSANSLFNLTFTLAQGVGFIILAPVVIRLVDVKAVFVVGAGLFGLAGLFVSWLPRGQGAAQRAPDSGGRMTEGMWEDIAEGWRALRTQPILGLAMVQLTVSATLVLLLVVLAPGFAVRVLSVRPDDIAFMALPLGLGVLGGIWLTGRRGHLLAKEQWVTLGLLLIGISLGVVALAQSYLLWLSLGMTVILGLGISLVNIPGQTILQEYCPPHLRGRIFAVQFMLASAFAIGPLLFAAGMADLFGIVWVMGGVALSILGLAWVSFRYGPRVPSLPQPLPLEALPQVDPFGILEEHPPSRSPQVAPREEESGSS